MSNRSHYYVVSVSGRYLHRTHEVGADCSVLTPHLDEAYRFRDQRDAVREAGRVYATNETHDVVARRVSFETVARHNARRAKKVAT